MRENTLHNEQTLLKLAAAGNREAFAKLYTRWLDELQYYLFLFTKDVAVAEEMMQDIFLKIWENKEKLSQIQAFNSWLFRIAKNELIDYVRHERVKQRVLGDLSTQHHAAYDGPEQQADYNQYYQIAQDAIAQLPPKRKEVFKLYMEQGLNYEEIAARLNISKSVVKKQLYAAFEFIRAWLQRYGICMILLYAQTSPLLA